MRRGAKPAKAVRRKSLANEASSRRQLEKRLAEALEQQTATSEILRVISSSPTHVQPVFDAIAQSAARLCEAQFCHVFQFDGELLHLVAHHGLTPEGAEAVRRAWPMAPSRESAAGRPGRGGGRPAARGHGARADAGQEVRGAARGAHRGPEPGGPGVHVHLHPASSV